MSSSRDGWDPDPSSRDVVSSRTFAAPRERVFAAFVEPARLTRWWGPDGFTNDLHAFDPRPGGIWRSTMRAPDGAAYPSESVFVEVVPPERIVFRHLSAEHPFEMTITLDDRGDGTLVTWRMRHATAEECDRVRPFVVAGNEQNFDRLARELAIPTGSTGRP
jgi:uncharacterized protein YndB with AHSA1/START domain